MVAQNFDDAAPWILGCRGPLGDLDINGNVFQIAPVSPAGGFVAENAVLRNRPWSLRRYASQGRLKPVVGRSRRAPSAIPLSFSTFGLASNGRVLRSCQGRSINNQRLILWILHSLRDDALLRNLLVDRYHVVASR